MELKSGNFFGSTVSTAFAQHAGAFSLVSETPGTPDNVASYNFASIAPGGCELIQVDFTTPVITAVNTEFITQATVSPASGDPTPANNISTILNTVIGSFDPNSILSYPARNGNPHDGGNILLNGDQKITYQIFFQNKGTAPANNIIVRDTLDQSLDLATITNVSASHHMAVSIEGNNDILVFKFPNINLPDDKSDYANSIGTIQYDIERKPGLPAGTQIQNQASIYFDFNPPVRTNHNVLKINTDTGIKTPLPGDHNLVVFPNPTTDYFGFDSESAGVVSVFNAMGGFVLRQSVEAGLQRVSAVNLPDGVYMIRLDAGGWVRNGKVVVSH
jgi:uncharacterized repeat protein (TIGR01451 family)